MKRFYIRCTKPNGESYWAWQGNAWSDKSRAEAEAQGCAKQWPEIQFVVVELDLDNPEDRKKLQS